ncbi:exodeoxyribonuclease V subunit gamma [Vibrio lentus]|nr:exodeoxyribonuclease V subunit gamma [Vibrio lentus]
MRFIPFKTVCLLGSFSRWCLPPLNAIRGFRSMNDAHTTWRSPRRDEMTEGHLISRGALRCSPRMLAYISYVGRSIQDNTERATWCSVSQS